MSGDFPEVSINSGSVDRFMTFSSLVRTGKRSSLSIFFRRKSRALAVSIALVSAILLAHLLNGMPRGFK